ncbi:MAG: hypothetical protein K2O18_17090 [Oscillospiraceae bacterium]|nr:hypothetical protein [Oscillospiraceae bacterium]
MTFDGISVQSPLPVRELTDLLKTVTDMDGLVCTASEYERKFIPAE